MLFLKVESVAATPSTSEKDHNFPLSLSRKKVLDRIIVSVKDE